MLTYRRTNNLEIIGYFDSDCVGCKDTRRFTSDYVFMLSNGLIYWRRYK